jgi:hypothetical protein
MKKQIFTILAAGSLSLSAFAQGSVSINDYLPPNYPGVTTFGTNATSTSLANTWFTGTLSLSIYYAASATTNQLNAINAYLNVSGGYAYALALLGTDGFVKASTTNPTNSTVGSVSGTVTSGQFAFSQSTVGLTGVPTSTSAYLVLVATVVGGAYDGYSGIIAFANNTGGSPLGGTPGTPALLTGWGTLNENLVLSQVPEPATLALLGFGGLSLLLFRRKNS